MAVKNCTCGLCMTDDQLEVLMASSADQREILKSLTAAPQKDKNPKGRRQEDNRGTR